jgi:signal transduction histidine kinase
LHPDGLAHLPLSAALNAHARQVSSLSGLQILVTENAPTPIIIDENARIAFYRAAQELLTNITRHAQASEVEISLRADDTYVVMEVSDDGIGTDPRSMDKDGALGLLGIQERFVALGGTLQVRRNESAGITVSISIPLTRGHSR